MNKRKKIITILILFVIVLFLAYLLLDKYVLKNNFEKNVLTFADQNSKTVFEVNKIVLFSNCDAKNKTGSATNFTIENLYQYTDIAIFIRSPLPGEKTLENTLKEVHIDHLQYQNTPQLGNPKLYFKKLSQFAKSTIPEENEIQDSFHFIITSENEANLDTPVLYNNLANPITLSYVNENIKTDYTITDTSMPITYDGSLLKKCKIDLKDVSCSFSLDLHITNHLDQKFKSTIYITLPLEADNQSLYNGSIKTMQNPNFTFYRYE